MRSLIRPTLFMVARIGLVLSVVGWVASQWYSIESFGGFTAASAFCVTGKSGIIVGFTNFKVSWRFDVSEGQSRPMWAFDYSEPEFSGLREQVSLVEPVSGLVLILDKYGVSVAFRHWLVVTFCALFYGMLKWVYRERGGEGGG